jgi:hypothetical protein
MRTDKAHTKQFPDAPVLDKPYEAPLVLEALRRALARST